MTLPQIRGMYNGDRQRKEVLVDYGFPRSEYYHPQRAGGTLMCHLRHHAHGDPFTAPGLQDITAHVDFTAMADAALEAGMQVLGYTSQARFQPATSAWARCASENQSEPPAAQ